MRGSTEAVHPQTGASHTVECWGATATDGAVWVTPEAYTVRADAPLLGQVFDGRYAVYDARVLPNSVVYFAAHMHLDDDRHVFIKRVRPEHPHQELAVRRLRHEARFLARLPKHPNLPQLYDLVLIDDAYYLVMERAPGRSLSSLLTLTRTLPIPVAIAIMDQVLDALTVCHTMGVVHRDLKPSNILVHRDAGALRVTLVDFGIAKDLVQRDVTDLGTRLQPGTPAYMSPEQAWNGAVTPSSDLYSATAMLHRMITGAAPTRDGEDGMGGVTLAPDLSPALQAVFETGLALFPDGRFADCAALQAALRALPATDVEPVSAPQTEGGTEHAPAVIPRPAEHRRRAWPWVVAVVLLIAGGVFAFWPTPTSEPMAIIDASVAATAIQPAPILDAAVIDAAPPSIPLDMAMDAAPRSDALPDAAVDAAPVTRPRAKVVKRPRRGPPPIPRATVQLAAQIRSRYVDRCQCGPAYGAAVAKLAGMRGGEALIQARRLKSCVHLFSPDLQTCVEGRPVMRGDTP